MINLFNYSSKIVFIVFLNVFFLNDIYAGCSPASPGATACSGCTAATGQTITSTVCYSGSGTFASFTINSGGTLRVCGTLTITSLTIGAGTTAIVVESGGSLTISNALTCTATNTITNRGTLVFTGAVSMDASTTIVNDISSSIMTFSSDLTTGVGLIVNRGTINFNGVVTFSGSATYCPEASVANFNYASPWTASFSGTPFSNYGGGAGSYAVLNFANQCAISGSVFPAEYRICNTTSFSNYNAGTMGGTSSGAAACSFPPLPVILTSFTAKSNANSVDLAWVTAQEFNNDHFELERSHDGMNFEKIKDIKGNGTKNSPTTYIFNDSEVNTLMPIYYRLKQVDEDGKFEYSNVIVLNGAEGNSSIEIYPNPLEEGTTLYARFGDNDEGTAKVSLFDLSGKLINEYMLDNIQPNGIYAVEDKNLLLVEGSYILQIKTLQNVYNQKLEVR